MRLVVNKIVAEFNKILGGSKRVGDAYRLEGKRHYDLDVKNAATLGHKSESTLNVNHSVYTDNSEKLRSVGIDGNPDVNTDGNPVFKTEEQLRVSNAQTLQDVIPLNLEVDIARRLKVGDQPDSPIISVSSLITHPAIYRVKDSGLLGGKTEDTLDVRRSEDSDNADLLNDTVQSELKVREAQHTLFLKRSIGGALIAEEDLYVKSSELFRKGASSYDVWTYRDYVLEHDNAKSILVDVASSSYTLTTPDGNKNWVELSAILKDTTTSEVYKASHLITDDSSNPVMTGAEVKNWIIGHSEFVAKVATLTSAVADRATTFGSSTNNYDIDAMKALIIASVVDVATLAKNSSLLENKTTAEIIDRIRNEIFETADITTDEAAGFFGNNHVKIAVQGIKVANAINSDTLETYSLAQVKAQVKLEGEVTSSKYLYTDPTNVNAGRKSYIDLTTDIADLRTLLRGDAAVDYNAMGKIEDIIIANKSQSATDLSSEAATRLANDNTLDSRIDTTNTALNVEKGRIDTVVAVGNAGDPDTFIKAKVITDAITVRVADNETAISDLKSSSSTAIANLADEMDTIEVSIGLEQNGGVTLPTGAYFNSATTVIGLSVALDSALVTEANTRATNDSNLQDNIDTEKARITQEVTDRTSADSVLQGAINTNEENITSEVSNRIAAITAEETARVDANTALSNTISVNTTAISDEVTARTNAVTTEANNRASADTTLTNSISTNATNLATEISDRTSADSGLDTKITANTTAISTETTDRQSAVSTEASTRASADTTLQGNIDTLTTNLSTEINDRATAISTEATTRSDADIVLQSNIDDGGDNLSTEILARINAVADEATARSDADIALQGNIDTKVNKAQELYLDAILTNDTSASLSTRYYVDVTNNTITVTLPETSNLVNFDKILFHCLAGDFTINNLTIVRPGGNTDTIMKSTEPLIVSTNDETFTLVFVNNDWRIL